MKSVKTRGGPAAVRLKRLDDDTFTRLADATRLQEAGARMARRVLVEGWSVRRAAHAEGLAAQRAQASVDIIRRAHAEHAPLAGYGCVELPMVVAAPLSQALQAADEASGTKELLGGLAQALKVAADAGAPVGANVAGRARAARSKATRARS